MDNFIDKLAQKFSAQEIIKANSEAETAEYEKVKMQVVEYEKILQEIRKLNCKNAELTEKINTTIGSNADKIHELEAEEQKIIDSLKELVEEQKKSLEQEKAEREQERARMEEELHLLEEERLRREEEVKKQAESDMNALTEYLDEKFQQSDDFVHKENVKVYRNVQAVVVDELKMHADGLHEGNGQIMSHINRVFTVSIISMVASLASMILWALTTFHIIK